MDFNKPLIFDSCVWIAIFVDSDSLHEKAKKFVGDMTNAVLVPEYVLLEVTTILRNKKKSREADIFIESVFATPETLIPCSQILRDTANLFTKRNDKLSFVDTALLVLSKDYKIVTLDKGLQKAIEKV